MIFDPHVDTKEEILAIRKAAMASVREGKTVMSWASEGSSANLQFTLPVEQVLEETLAFLRIVDPDRYGTRVKYARASFGI